MSDTHIEDNKISQMMHADFFRSYIESGDAEIGNRAANEIVDDFFTRLREFLRNLLNNTVSLKMTTDHKESLLERARDSLSNDDAELAVILYAAWVEHAINGLLRIAMVREGYPDSIIKLLLKQNWPEKMREVWVSVGLPEVPSAHSEILKKLMQVRNEFIHYKWSGEFEEDIKRKQNDQEEIVNRVESLVESLSGVERSYIWNDRQDELLAVLSDRVEDLPVKVDDTDNCREASSDSDS